MPLQEGEADTFPSNVNSFPASFPQRLTLTSEMSRWFSNAWHYSFWDYIKLIKQCSIVQVLFKSCNSFISHWKTPVCCLINWKKIDKMLWFYIKRINVHKVVLIIFNIWINLSKNIIVYTQVPSKMKVWHWPSLFS